MQIDVLGYSTLQSFMLVRHCKVMLFNEVTSSAHAIRGKQGRREAVAFRTVEQTTSDGFFRYTGLQSQPNGRFSEYFLVFKEMFSFTLAFTHECRGTLGFARFNLVYMYNTLLQDSIYQHYYRQGLAKISSPKVDGARHSQN